MGTIKNKTPMNMRKLYKIVSCQKKPKIQVFRGAHMFFNGSAIDKQLVLSVLALVDIFFNKNEQEA